MNRVNIICDVENLQYDQRNAALFAFTDYIHSYPYPQLPVNENKGFNDIAGIEGDPVLITCGFRVETAIVGGVQPILNKVTISVVAVKAGFADFPVETRIFNTSNSCSFGNVPQINIAGTKGNISYPGDPFNSFSLKNDNTKTVGTKAGYNLQYALVLRYDYWRQITSTLPGQNSCNNDINNDIPNVNNSWHNLNNNGWQLVLRVQADVIGYDGFTTSFQGQTNIRVLPIGSPADGLLQYTKRTQYLVLGPDGFYVEQPSILKGGVTKIVSTWTYNGFPTNGMGRYFGYVFIDLPGIGGVNVRRFASTEVQSEQGSPFSDPGEIAAPPNTMDQYSYGGLRLGWYKRGVNFGTVILTTLYNDTVKWSRNTAPVSVFRLGFTPTDDVLADSRDRIVVDSHGHEIIP